MHADLIDASVHVPQSAVVDLPTHEEIAERAFQLFERRGGVAGCDLDDWLEAERQILLERVRLVADAGHFAS